MTVCSIPISDTTVDVQTSLTYSDYLSFCDRFGDVDFGIDRNVIASMTYSLRIKCVLNTVALSGKFCLPEDIDVGVEFAKGPLA